MAANVLPSLRGTCRPSSMHTLALVRLAHFAVTYTRFGTATQVLRREKVSPDDRVLLARQCGSPVATISMLYAPLNPSDLNMVEGTYPLLPKELPAIAGNEGVGVVTSIVSHDGMEVLATDDGEVRVGGIVIPRVPLLGTWREEMVVSTDKLRHVPEGVPPRVASILSVNPATALRLLTDFIQFTREGEGVLVQNGATSGVGKAVIELAQSMNIKTVNVIRKKGAKAEMQREMLYALGADLVVQEGETRKEMMAMGFPKASLALNCIGGPSSREVASVLKDGGTLVTYGGMSRLPIEMSTSSFIFKNIVARGFWLSRWKEKTTNVIVDKMFEDLFSYAQKGFFNSNAIDVPFSRFDEALRLSQESKVLLKFGDS